MIPMMNAQVITELQSMRILFDLEAHHIGGGGVNGSEGSVVIAEGWPAWTKARKGMTWAVAVTAFLITVVAHLQPLYLMIPIPAQRPF